MDGAFLPVTVPRALPKHSSLSLLLWSRAVPSVKTNRQKVPVGEREDICRKRRRAVGAVEGREPVLWGSPRLPSIAFPPHAEPYVAGRKPSGDAKREASGDGSRWAGSEFSVEGCSRPPTFSYDPGFGRRSPSFSLGMLENWLPSITCHGRPCRATQKFDQMFSKTACPCGSWPSGK